MSAGQKTPNKRSISEQSSNEEQSPQSSKRARGNRGSSALRTIEDGKAILKDLGFEEEETPGRRRTRSSARAQVSTPTSIKKESKSRPITPSSGKRGRPSSKAILKKQQEAEAMDAEKSEAESDKDKEKATATPTKEIDTSTADKSLTSPSTPAKTESSSTDSIVDTLSPMKSESPIKPGETLTPTASPIKLTNSPVKPTVSPIKPDGSPEKCSEMDTTEVTSETDTQLDKDSLSSSKTKDVEPTTEKLSTEPELSKEGSPAPDVPPKPTPLAVAPTLPPKPSNVDSTPTASVVKDDTVKPASVDAPTKSEIVPKVSSESVNNSVSDTENHNSVNSTSVLTETNKSSQLPASMEVE